MELPRTTPVDLMAEAVATVVDKRWRIMREGDNLEKALPKSLQTAFLYLTRFEFFVQRESEESSSEIYARPIESTEKHDGKEDNKRRVSAFSEIMSEVMAFLEEHGGTILLVIGGAVVLAVALHLWRHPEIVVNFVNGLLKAIPQLLLGLGWLAAILLFWGVVLRLLARTKLFKKLTDSPGPFGTHSLLFLLVQFGLILAVLVNAALFAPPLFGDLFLTLLIYAGGSAIFLATTTSRAFERKR